MKDSANLERILFTISLTPAVPNVEFVLSLYVNVIVFALNDASTDSIDRKCASWTI
mgnify:CR=1 FL=1